jgi:phenylacetate-CoA ligase
MTPPVARTSLPRRAAWTAWVARNAPREIRFPFRSRATIERAQRRRLQRVVAHAYEHVPYYRETMRRLGLAPGDLKIGADLAKLPLLERHELQRDPEYFVSRKWPLEAHLLLRSGGSTGEPIKVFRHPFALFQGAAYRERARGPIMAIAGKRLRLHEALIVLTGVSGAGPEFARRTFLPSSVRVVRTQISLLTPLAEAVQKLNDLRPDAIATYGSYLEALFTHVLESGVPFEAPKVVAYSSDALSERGRRLLSEHFGVEALSIYRAIEAPQIGFECERHTGHHVNVDLCPVRILNTDGRELPVGEQGEVVVSNLYGQGTVLLNYRLGDRAALLPDECTCGRNLPLMSMVDGRVDEWLLGPDGNPVHGNAVRSLLRVHDDVLRFQIVQVEARRFTAALVTRPDADREAMARRLEGQLRELFGAGAELEVTFPSDLERTPGGKVIPVRSLVAEHA